MEYIGFLISLLALIYLYFRQQSLARHRQEHLDAQIYQESDEEDALSEFIKTIQHKTDKKATVQPPPPPASKPVKTIRKDVASTLQAYHLESPLEKRQLKSSLESRQLKSGVRKQAEERAARDIAEAAIHAAESPQAGPSRAKTALRRLAHRRDLAIYQEIIDKPKSMRPFP